MERNKNMIVNVEFFDENPLENVITSLNYKIDKTIFFGYSHIVKEHGICVEKFLKEQCGVQEVEICVVDEVDLPGILDSMSNKIQEEIQQGNQVFFDLTGGESLLLVSFGILSKEFQASMHLYNVATNQIYEYGYGDSAMLSKTAEYDPIVLDLDGLVSLYGGIINYRMKKDFKNAWAQEEIDDIEQMWKLSRIHQEKWVHYSGLLRKFAPDDTLTVCMSEKQLIQEMRQNKQIGNLSLFQKFLQECERKGFVKNLLMKNGMCQFVYKNDTIMNYFWDGGSILEMYAFVQMSKEDYDDCRVGVHIDWDGTIHSTRGSDVLNEVDIMAVKNNIPTLVSCKIGNVDQMALYELETVANRFGGKYAKKVLKVGKKVTSAHSLRAKEMGIEIDWVK